ncbi:MAG: hypothetical protein Q7R35_18750 [Elusimicrobiota bacterium]|nr:hypothetical protein [Elusimicrobiota bacterium]
MYPLNRLKEVHPDLHARYSKKYVGREWMNKLVIPPLNCLWNDVLHFSLTHPAMIYGILSGLGFEHHKAPREWFEVPLEDIKVDSSILYRNEEYDKDKEVRDSFGSDFEPVNPARVMELSVMPERNLNYYKSCLEKKIPPLLWGYAPHLLYKGKLEVGAYRTLDWKNNT